MRPIAATTQMNVFIGDYNVRSTVMRSATTATLAPRLTYRIVTLYQLENC